MARQFHRPARLDPEAAEQIEGSTDTAVASELAHRAAQALIGGFPGTETEDDPITRSGVVAAVATNGIDDIAELWADSPATTLPGTLWRLFLVREWIRRDPELVARRYAILIDLTEADEATTARLESALGEARPVPSPTDLRERLDAGELGQVYQVLTRRQGPFPARISDVGVVKDLATHDIDLTAWVAGARYTSVAAQVTHRSGRQTEDMMVATGLLEGGIVVSHQVNWLTPFKERVTIVTGEKGAFVADTLTGDLTFHANGTVASTWDQVAAFRGVSEGDVIRYAIPKREPLALEQENFRDAVRGVAQRHVTMAEGVATLDVVEAVLTSASENRTVAL